MVQRKHVILMSKLFSTPLSTHLRALGMGGLLALSMAALAQGNSNSSSPNRIRPMSTEATSNVTAFFYQQPVVLDREKHKGLRLKSGDARFAAKNQAVPLVMAEFPEACLEYPIVFTQGGDNQWLALALTGLKLNANAFVDAQGRWNARYVPASVRRYPFILAESDNNQLNLAVDMAAPNLGKEGEVLLDDKGEPSEFVRGIMPLLADFQTQAKATSALTAKLHEAGLLMQQNLQVQLGDGRQAVVEGVWVVDEAKLRELSDDKIVAWFKSGELSLVYAQMLSLRNLLPLLERSLPAPAPSSADKPAAKKTESAKGKAGS